jgi:DNA processing protein
MNDRGLLDLIISLLPGFKIAEKTLLLQAFDEERELFIQSKRDIERLLKREIKHFWDISEIRDRADRIDTICAMRSIKWVSWASAEYPPLLREMYDPPSVIFYRGVLPNPEKSLLGMVGTRRPSPEAADQAFKLACDIGKAGVSVVSGLAFGIDAMSHRGNLCAGVPGYAVLGSGVDEIYPSTNRQLAKRILDLGGALISEYPPGTGPKKWNFPERNRIIAALSRSVLIVEAPQKSGALITGNFALDQGKELWAASSGIRPNAAFDKRGTEKLAQDGAQIIYRARDILEKWGMEITAGEEDNMVSGGEICRREFISSLADFLDIEV